MRWRGRKTTSNIEDRRNQRMSSRGPSGGSPLIRLVPMLFKILGVKGTLLVGAGLLVYGLVSGNLNNILSLLGAPNSAPTSQASMPLQESTQEKELVEFISVVLADTEQAWSTIFSQLGKQYKEPKLVLFRDSVKSACGMANAAVGPFYCPADQKIYIDLAFYEQLKNEFKAPGDFAQAYVIAHEVGHHVQTLLGTSQKVHAAKRQLNTTEANKLSVLQELQADCYSGVWAYHAENSRQLLESGDIEEGLTAASAIGDDTLQKQAQGYVRPESFTHGTSQQRVKWFSTGYRTGSIDSCNTFI